MEVTKFPLPCPLPHEHLLPASCANYDLRRPQSYLGTCEHHSECFAEIFSLVHLCLSFFFVMKPSLNFVLMHFFVYFICRRALCTGICYSRPASLYRYKAGKRWTSIHHNYLILLIVKSGGPDLQSIRLTVP